MGNECFKADNVYGVQKKTSHKKTLTFQGYKKYTTYSEFAPYFQLIMQQPKVRDLEQVQKQLFRQVMTHLMESRFNSEGLSKTCQLCYKLSRLGKFKDQYFWFLPFHILFFYAKTAVGQRTHKQNFLLETEIEDVLKKLANKYPPTEKQLVQNSEQIENFKMEQLPDLLEGKEFTQIQQFYNLVEELNVQSHKLLPKFQKLLQEIFKVKGDLHSFKAGTKLPKQKNMKYAKSLIRISQKYFAKYIDFKKFRQEANYNGSYEQYFQTWIDINQQQIRQLKLIGEENQKIQEGDQFLFQGKQNNKKQNKFYTYDLLRAKCQFSSVSDIVQTLQLFKKKQQQNKLQIVIIKNRLNLGTKDVLINIKLQNIVCQVQLALEFDKANNQFNHKLYELIRDPAGVMLACLLLISSQDSEEMYFYRQLAISCDSPQSIKSFNFLLTIIQQFFPSNVLPLQFNSQYCSTKAYSSPIIAQQKWNCVYDQFGKQFQYSFDQFSTQNNIVEGEGVDLVGLFYIIGQKNGESIEFQKKYFKKHTIYYEGFLQGSQIQGTYGSIQKNMKSQALGSFKIFYKGE